MAGGSYDSFGIEEGIAAVGEATIMSLEPHPSQFERVTVESVREALGSANPSDHIWTVQPGVVRVEVTGATKAGRTRAQQCVLDLLASKHHQAEPGVWAIKPYGWRLLAPERTYQWRPWRTWVTVRDAATEWIDPETGLDYCSLIAHQQQQAENNTKRTSPTDPLT